MLCLRDRVGTCTRVNALSTKDFVRETFEIWRCWLSMATTFWYQIGWPWEGCEAYTWRQPSGERVDSFVELWNKFVANNFTNVFMNRNDTREFFVGWKWDSVVPMINASTNVIWHSIGLPISQHKCDFGIVKVNVKKQVVSLCRV